MKKYESHELASTFPMAAKSRISTLAENIKLHGQQEKAILLDGKILDGRNRAEACEMAGVELLTETWLEYLARTNQPADKDPLDVIVALNMERRHLSDSQRSIIAAKYAKAKRGGSDKKGDKVNGAKATISAAAKKLNVKAGSVKRAKTVIKKGTKAIQIMAEEGQLPVATAAAAAELPKDVQDTLAAAGPEAVKAGVAEAKAAKKKGSKKQDKHADFRAKVVNALENLKEQTLKSKAATPREVFDMCLKCVEDV